MHESFVVRFLQIKVMQRNELMNIGTIRPFTFFLQSKWCYHVSIFSFTLLLLATILLQMTLYLLICQLSLNFSYFMKKRELNIVKRHVKQYEITNYPQILVHLVTW